MILEGYVKDKNNCPVPYALAELKDDRFETLYMTYSDENGYYRLDVPEGIYPFFMVVKGYKETALEYWCQDIPLYKDITLDAKFDTLEVYGLHVFSVKGAGNGLMVYFRPMSLEKYKNGCKDIAPDDISIKILIDDKDSGVVNVNKIQEYAAEHRMSAYLVQVDCLNTDSWCRLDVEITDSDGNYGAASIFNKL